MTALVCDVCKKEVDKFKTAGSSNFPEGSQEVCEDCWEKVNKAIDVAADAADAAYLKTFDVTFKKEIKK